MFDLIGGPKPLKTKYVVNFFKGTTLFYCVLLMHYFKNFSIEAMVYT